MTNGTNGTVAIVDGQAVYTPNADFNGEDTFTYTVTTEPGNTETATVTVTVTGVPDANDDNADDGALTDEDTPVTIDVLANDSFGPDAVLSDASDPPNGTVAIVDGEVVYTPDPDFHGEDTFTYTVTTPDGGTETATVTVTVNPVPDIVDDAVTTPEDTPVTIDVLDNDDFESTPTLTG